MNKALITGATAGIGRATAKMLAGAGLAVIACGRRAERLDELKAELTRDSGGRGAVETLVLDIADRAACERVFREHAVMLEGLDVLVNNAGLAKGLELMQDADIAHWDEMINTNVKGLLYLTRLALPGMLEQGRGHIVNVGSVAGRWVYPRGAVYCATKFAVRALSEGLRFDLLGTPIRVTNIEPGMVETEFSKVRLESDERARAVYKGMTPLRPEDIAETILWSLSRPAHVNIQELVIYPTDQASVQNVSRKE